MSFNHEEWNMKDSRTNELPSLLQHDVSLNHDSPKQTTVVERKSPAEQRRTDNVGIGWSSSTIKVTGGMHVPQAPDPRAQPQGARTVITVVVHDEEVIDE